VQPVLRLGPRVDKALVGETSIERRGRRSARIATLQRGEIGDQVLQFRVREPRRVVARHERAVFVPDLGEFQLVEQMKLTGPIHHLQRERVFVTTDTAQLSTVFRPCDDDQRSRTATATAER
jgi:hypothetical protein